MSEKRLAREDDGYAEFARKMDLFENGPTTTNFEQLVSKNLTLPKPEDVADTDIRTKLWEVLAGLGEFRVYLSETDHLSDRQLYERLWHDVLRVDTAAIDEIGFNTHVQLLSSGDESDTQLYLRYYADEEWRAQWLKDFPDTVMPAPEDPPYDRDYLLPHAHYTLPPEALPWLRANHNPTPFAGNRFATMSSAVTFVEQLYAAGATKVSIDNIRFLPSMDWAPYADTLLVDLPDDGQRRRALFEVMVEVGQPDEDGDDWPIIDHGQNTVRLWWN